MSILQQLLQLEAAHTHRKGLTVAFLGDSVTQGCFEVYKNKEDRIVPVFEPLSGYPYLLHKKLATAYPSVPFHIVNAGISGDCAPNGCKRLARDVLSHTPDLTVVCYGLNDCADGESSVEKYAAALREILCRLQESGGAVIFMTPNMMNDSISAEVSDPDIRAVAERKCELQTSGHFTRHIDAARALCRELNVPVCDCYAKWQALADAGEDVTDLLCNRINHPTREMHALFADELLALLQAPED